MGRFRSSKWILPPDDERAVCCMKSYLLTIALSLLLGASIAADAQGGTATRAYFAGGCFWCTQEIFSQLPGVTSVTSGYMEGAETIEVRFDPARTSYDKLLDLFWRAHDPTEVDRQGPDVGRQYRSAIFYVDAAQRAVAEKSRARLAASGKFSRPIATEISPAAGFRRADEHHQNFCRKNPNNRYIQQTLVPKLKKLGMKTP